MSKWTGCLLLLVLGLASAQERPRSPTEREARRSTAEKPDKFARGTNKGVFNKHAAGAEAPRPGAGAREKESIKRGGAKVDKFSRGQIKEDFNKVANPDRHDNGGGGGDAGKTTPPAAPPAAPPPAPKPKPPKP